MKTRILLVRLVRIASVLALASACGHVADDGSSTSWAACSLNSECTLAGKSCCEPCGTPTLAEVDAVNSSRLDEHRSAICPGPVACAPCEVPSAKNANLFATCSNAVCEAGDVRTDPASACTTDDDCRLRTTSCCECGGSTANASLIAVNRSTESTYRAKVCDPLQACPKCAVIYPTDVTAHCASDGHCAIRAATAPVTVDLPLGWESAERVTELVQQQCSGSPYDHPNETVDVAPGKAKLGIDYHEAHFRCAQDVEGFARRVGSGIDVLVQPVDMNPSSVTRCDCTYEITILLDPVASGTHDVAVYRRWDNLNDPNEPVKIGGASVQIE